MDWAATWKKAAKNYRREWLWWRQQAISELARRARLEASQGIREAKDVIELRAALDRLLRCTAYREFGHCAQCEQRAQIALKNTAPSEKEAEHGD